MPRYALKVGYDGRLFYGWQRQPGLATVQSAIEEALSKIDGSRVSVAGAGRTDVGVHARAQVCSFDTEKKWEPRRLLLAVNAHLPDGVSALAAARTAPDFHARFDAKSREYVYFIWNESALHPMMNGAVCWIKPVRHDWSRAAKACEHFIGEHDFRAFCRSADRPDDCVRTIYRARLSRRGALVMLRVQGSGFLTNMVRIIAGSLEKIAKGDREPEWIKNLLDEKSGRAQAGRTLSANGLYLWRINYVPSPWG